MHKSCYPLHFFNSWKELVYKLHIGYMPTSRKKKKTSGTVMPEVETKPPSLALLPDDVCQTLHHGETSEYTSPSEDAPLVPTRGKEALRSATLGNALSQEPPLNPASMLL
jgi:hypothetical protein